MKSRIPAGDSSKRRLFAVLVGLLVAASAASAQAAALGFTGSLSLSIAALDPIVLAGFGTANVNGSAGAGHLDSMQLAGGTFATTARVMAVTDPAAAPVRGIRATFANGPGSFVDGPPLGGVMPLIGAVKVCLFGPCGSAVANLVIPLSPVGVGGFANVTAAQNLTVYGAPWTTGTVAIGAITAMGGSAPASNTGGASGTVSLVTPIFVRTNSAVDPIVPVFAYLNLHFVPEPGTLVLLGAGIAGLIAQSRSSRNRA